GNTTRSAEFSAARRIHCNESVAFLLSVGPLPLRGWTAATRIFMVSSFARHDDATRRLADELNRKLPLCLMIGESFASPCPFKRRRKGSKRFADASHWTQDTTRPFAERTDSSRSGGSRPVL